MKPGTVKKAEQRFNSLVEMERDDPTLDEKGREQIENHAHLRPLERMACKREYDRFARRWLKIRTKDRKIARIQAWPGQKKLRAAIREQMRAGKPVRIRYLKARQVGVTTDAQGMAYHQMCFTKGTEALTVAHNLDTARRIFRILRLYHDCCPEWLRPEVKYSTRKEMSFPKLRNHVEIETAKDFAIRGGTFQFVHCSEVGFWPGNPEETKLALYNCVPDKPKTFVIEESTANGILNAFHDEWYETEEALKQGRETLWRNVFTAWWEHPEYCLPVDRREAEFIMGHLDREEQQLVDWFKLSPGQLKWRKRVIQDKCNGDRNRFRQEFPAYADEAFISSGRPYFRRQTLVGWRQAATPDPDGDPNRGVIFKPLRVATERVGPDDEEAAVHTYEAQASVYEMPQQGVRYAIGCDVAEGVESAKGSDPDYNVAFVIREDTFDQVAMLRGRWDADVFAEFAYDLGKFYNDAMVAPEAHGIGQTVVTRLRRNGTRANGTQRPPYPNLFYRYGAEGSKKVYYGWETTVATKPTMLQRAQAFVREGTGRIRDGVAIDEHMAMEVQSDGKVEVTRGHDDCIMARCIAIMAVQTLQLRAEDDDYADGGEPVTPYELAMAYEERIMEEAQEDFAPGTVEPVEEDML